MINENFILASNHSAYTGVAFDNFSKHVSLSHTLFYNNCPTKSTDNFFILISGFFLPRNEFYSEYEKYQPLDLIEKLYTKFGNEFVLKIKGIFCIVIFSQNQINIFTDQLGLYKLFYHKSKQIDIVSNSINHIRKTNVTFSIDTISIATQAILNRTIAPYTIFKNVFVAQPATHINMQGETAEITNYFLYKNIIKQKIFDKNNNIDYFKNLLLVNCKNYQNYLKPKSNVITITGGKDSRTGLATLLNIGMKPIGFTYGNPQSRDAIYASKLVKQCKIEHYQINPNFSEFDYNTFLDEYINFGNPEISIHRALRSDAFNKISTITGIDTAYFSGYLAGEILMGVYFDNLIFTNFLLNYYKTNNFIDIPDFLKKRFLNENNIIIENLKLRLLELNCFQPNLTQKEFEFHALFEIGINHHSQDIFLSNKKFKYSIPLFLDIDLLEPLLISKFSFFNQNNKTTNPLKRHALYEFNVKIQHQLAPHFDEIPFGKRGSYNAKEYLKGKFYWSFIKSIRYLFDRKKHPPSYEYDQAYKKFLLNQLTTICNDHSSDIHLYYNLNATLKQLNQEIISGEANLHKFSNIVMHYKQMNYQPL